MIRMARAFAIAAGGCFFVALVEELSSSTGGNLAAWTLGGLLALAISAALR